eukprot:9199-Heterococcus_DN1.PRE.2
MRKTQQKHGDEYSVTNIRVHQRCVLTQKLTRCTVSLTARLAALTKFNTSVAAIKQCLCVEREKITRERYRVESPGCCHSGEQCAALASDDDDVEATAAATTAATTAA